MITLSIVVIVRYDYSRTWIPVVVAVMTGTVVIRIAVIIISVPGVVVSGVRIPVAKSESEKEPEMTVPSKAAIVVGRTVMVAMSIVAIAPVVVGMPA